MLCSQSVSPLHGLNKVVGDNGCVEIKGPFYHAWDAKRPPTVVERDNARWEWVAGLTDRPPKSPQQ